MSDQPTYQPDPAAEILAVVDAFFAALSFAFPSHADLTARLRADHTRVNANARDFGLADH